MENLLDIIAFIVVVAAGRKRERNLNWIAKLLCVGSQETSGTFPPWQVERRKKKWTTRKAHLKINKVSVDFLISSLMAKQLLRKRLSCLDDSKKAETSTTKEKLSVCVQVFFLSQQKLYHQILRNQIIGRVALGPEDKLNWIVYCVKRTLLQSLSLLLSFRRKSLSVTREGRRGDEENLIYFS